MIYLILVRLKRMESIKTYNLRKYRIPAGGLVLLPSVRSYYGYPMSPKHGAFLKEKIYQDELMHVQCVYD